MVTRMPDSATELPHCKAFLMSEVLAFGIVALENEVLKIMHFLQIQTHFVEYFSLFFSKFEYYIFQRVLKGILPQIVIIGKDVVTGRRTKILR